MQNTQLYYAMLKYTHLVRLEKVTQLVHGDDGDVQRLDQAAAYR
jgi:hypothetical protein